MLSSLPYLGKYIFAVSMSTLADYLRRTNKLSVTAIRKIFTTLGKPESCNFHISRKNFNCNCSIHQVYLTPISMFQP